MTEATREEDGRSQNGDGINEYIYDLQVHTSASPCSKASPAAIVESAGKAGLDGIAITDHDTLVNVELAQSVAPDTLDVISGVEVTTTQGHILAYDVDQSPPQEDPLSVIENIHKQDGVAVLSHPFDTLREHFEADLSAIATAVDGVETINSRCLRSAFNTRAAEFAESNQLAPTGGSDAHFPMEVGRAVTIVTDTPISAIRKGNTTVSGRGRYVSGHIATKLYEFHQRLKR